MPGGATVFVDYAGHGAVAGMRVCGMTVAERVLRQAAQAGATRAIVRGTPAELPALPTLPLVVELVPPATPTPADATPVAGDVLAGVRIFDERTRRAASRALLQTCRRAYDGLGDRYVIRALSLRLSRAWCWLGVTPNQITWVNILVGLAACAFAASGTRFALVAAGALMFVQVVLDSCDGEVARLRYLSSKFGMWLDNTSDDLIDNLFTATLAIGIGGIWLPLGVAAAICKSLTAVMIHVDVARRGKPGDVMAFKWFFDSADEDLAERFDTGTSLAGIGRAFGRRDMYILVWAVTCAAGVPVIGLCLGLVISFAYLGLAIVHLAVSRRA